MNKGHLIPSFNIKAISASVVDIEIFDIIGEEFDWLTEETYGISYEEFKAKFTEAESKYDRINVRINSVGGSVHVGNVMFNLMASSKKEIHTYVDGAAYSMSAILVQVAPKGNRHAASNAMYMLHAASGYQYRSMNAAQYREEANTLEKFDQSLATSLVENLGISKEEVIAKYFDGKDHWFTAEEMLAEGLIDHIENYKAEQYTSTKNIVTARQEYYKVAASKQESPSIVAQIETALRKFLSPVQNQKPNSPIMDIKALQEKFNSATAGLILTTEEVAAFKAELNAFTEAKHTEKELTDAVNAAVSAKAAEMQKIIDEKQAIIDEKPNPAGGDGKEDPKEGEEKVAKFRRTY